MPAVIEIKIVPVGTDTPSFSSYVSDCDRVAEREGVRCQVTPTSTIIEGDLTRCMDVARKIHQACFHGRGSAFIIIGSPHKRKPGPFPRAPGGEG